ncbi:GTPase [Enterospora canceri]|uniref:GTPase n=1 Tax=Enterospora canceri TaxID=1081671 RepID=A0A1Y1S9B6_9MICR|nr:GTPase [Enterospora canceri]
MTIRFNKIAPVPQANELVDICLSKTNRGTPTVIHRHLEITRIRNFYIRKIRFCAEQFSERIEHILAEFPVLDDIHPFFSELITILYDKDTYKISLGKLNSTRGKIGQIAKHSIKMIKYGDTMYRCKCLKRAGLGQMASLASKLKNELKYLEEVRQHFNRLPHINPLGRTAIVAGFPNVGKSSYVAAVTKCKSEVADYAFTTKDIFVGHVEHKSLQYQFLDTPGILDHALDERSRVEMLTIGAMAHLKSVVLFFIDASGTCGHSLAEQVALFNSISVLLNSKFIIVLAKGDLVKEVPVELNEFLENKVVVTISRMDKESFSRLTSLACETILDEKVEMKQEKVDGFMHRIRVVESRQKLPIYQGSHLGTNSLSGIRMENEAYLTSEKYDTIPEIMNGKNIMDFYGHGNILEAVRQIDVACRNAEEYDVLNKEEYELYDQINDCRRKAVQQNIFRKRGLVVKGHEVEEATVANEQSTRPNAGSVKHNKKVKQESEKRVVDNKPRHLFRGISNKHARTR